MHAQHAFDTLLGVIVTKTKDHVVVSPDPRLKEVCEPIDVIDDEIKDLAERMLNLMYETDGVGLAAPQIGSNKKMCVIDVDWGDGPKNPYVLINPEIIVADGEMAVGSEGCLSFPGISVEVERPTHVVVHARNLEGKLLKYEASNNLLAVCLQHEIDHLNGITMVDHLTPFERVAAMNRYKKAVEAGARPGDLD